MEKFNGKMKKKMHHDEIEIIFVREAVDQWGKEGVVFERDSKPGTEFARNPSPCFEQSLFQSLHSLSGRHLPEFLVGRPGAKESFPVDDLDRNIHRWPIIPRTLAQPHSAVGSPSDSSSEFISIHASLKINKVGRDGVLLVPRVGGISILVLILWSTLFQFDTT